MGMESRIAVILQERMESYKILDLFWKQNLMCHKRGKQYGKWENLEAHISQNTPLHNRLTIIWYPEQGRMVPRGSKVEVLRRSGLILSDF
ncbi:hypothetical protein L1887_09128 [Cichorium endivia]|nr:hypothetical protein L1887_09128 [Cichorium endivia]